MTTKRESLVSIECNTSSVIGNNTFEYMRDNGERVIRLHMTDILTFAPDGTITFNSGGWQTVTTKARMNEYADPVYISQEKRIWYASVGRGDWETYKERRVPYKEGMTYHPDRGFEGVGSVKSSEILRKRVNRYAQMCVDKMPLPMPDSSDCMYCLMRNAGFESGKDTTHLEQHMLENYAVPSLVWQVLFDKGCDPKGIRGNAHFYAVFKTDTPWKTDRSQYKRWIADWMWRKMNK